MTRTGRQGSIVGVKVKTQSLPPLIDAEADQVNPAVRFDRLLYVLELLVIAPEHGRMAVRSE